MSKFSPVFSLSLGKARSKLFSGEIEPALERRGKMPFPLAQLALAIISLSSIAFSQPPCTAGMDFPGPNLSPPAPPPPITGGVYAQACAWLCHATPRCGAFTYDEKSTVCGSPHGCCALKASGSWLNATLNSKTACGAVMRHPPATFPPSQPPAAPPAGAKNVLHFVVDDLRPDLAPFGPDFMRTPALASLARTSTLFSRAYCNIAVCSPSRLSFLTGRRPSTSRSFNFINHFRQANCVELPATTLSGATYLTIPVPKGGGGQCPTAPRMPTAPPGRLI